MDEGYPALPSLPPIQPEGPLLQYGCPDDDLDKKPPTRQSPQLPSADALHPINFGNTGMQQYSPPINHKGPVPSQALGTKVPKERSIAHYPIVNGKAVFCSLDIETGGADWGIVQFSAELVRMDIVPGMNKAKNAKITTRKKRHR